MELRIPKLREGSYFPSLLDRSEKALLPLLQLWRLEGRRLRVRYSQRRTTLQGIRAAIPIKVIDAWHE